MDITSTALDSMSGAASSVPGFLSNPSDASTGLPRESGQSNSTTQFVKGINFNGDRISIADEAWLSQSAALQDGLTLSPNAPVQSDLITDAAVGKPFRDMLNSGIQSDSAAGGKDLAVTQTLDNGTYQLDLFMTAPEFQSRRFDITIEGTTVDQVTLNADKEGRGVVYSYDVTITDGALDLLLEKSEKSPLLSGLRLSALTDPVLPEPPVTVLSPPSSPSPSNTPSNAIGINFNGGAIAYTENETWRSQQEAFQNGLKINDSEQITSDVTVDDSISEDVLTMLSTGIKGSANPKDKDLTISQPIANGEHWVDLFIAPPTKRERIFEVEIEGQTLEQITVDEDSDGTWNVYSYKVDIQDGELNVVLDKTRKSPIISGMRISPVEPGDNTPLSPAISVQSSNISNRQVVEDDSPENSTPTQRTFNTTDNADALSSERDRSTNESNDVVVDSLPRTNSTSRSNVLSPSSNPTNGRLVWAEDFGPNWENRWPGFANTSAPENRRIIDDSQFGDVLRVSYRDGGIGPSDGTQFKVFLDNPMQSATVEYYLRFKPGFLPARGGKLPGFVGGEEGRKQEFTGGRTPSGLAGSGHSVRLGFRPAPSDPEKVIIGAYTYLHKGQQDPSLDDRFVVDAFGNQFRTARQWNFGTTTPFLDPDNLNSELIIQTGQWYKVALQVTLNTPGQKNGFIKGFVQEPGNNNLRLAMHVPNLSFQKQGANLPIDRLFFSSFFGGKADSYRAQRSEHIDFAGFKVYDNSR